MEYPYPGFSRELEASPVRRMERRVRPASTAAGRQACQKHGRRREKGRVGGKACEKGPAW